LLEYVVLFLVAVESLPSLLFTSGQYLFEPRVAASVLANCQVGRLNYPTKSVVFIPLKLCCLDRRVRLTPARPLLEPARVDSPGEGLFVSEFAVVERRVSLNRLTVDKHGGRHK